MKQNADYEGFKAEDFVLDESFQRYCLRVDTEAERFWGNWIAGHPQKLGDVQKAKELYLIINGGNDAESFEANRAVFRDRLLKAALLGGNEEHAKVIGMGVEKKRVKGLPVYRLMAAAAILLAVSISLFFINNIKKPEEKIAVSTMKPVDIQPGGNKAILTLSDGRQVTLDSAANGNLVTEGGVKVIKIDGKLAYNPENQSSEVLYNTITTPKGGQYQLELADGSRVWLNAASSLRFPTAFTGKDRMVELTGEGYFEVAHDPGKPFHVRVNDMDVQVLGTHFNINSYSDEPAVKTTLLEGRVKVNRSGKQLFLNPGQQAMVIPGQDAIRVAYDVDVEQVVAWKNGRFLFNSANIETIMRQAARWYDVEVVYEKNTTETFSGGLPRSENISQLIRILEATGKVDIKVSGKQVIVSGK